MASVKWTDANIGTATRILGNSVTIEEAVIGISATFGVPVTYDALRRAFSHRGLGHPGDYLIPELSPYAPVENDHTSKLSKVLIIPDTHVPFHDRKAFDLVLKVAEYIKPDTVVLMGDFADFYSVSAHSKDPNRVRSLADEVRDVNEALDAIDEIGARRKFYIEGNHEFRLARYLSDKAPALFNTVDVPELFRLTERDGWNWVPYREHCKIGKVYFTHECGNAGATAHTKAGAAFEHSVIIAHSHRAAISYFGNATGETHVAGMPGWLGDRDAADYMHTIKAKRDWQLAFSVGYLEDEGNMHVHLVPIIDYRCVVEGRLFT